MTSIHKGSCLCGEIEYEIGGDLGDPSLCHCSMCRKQHGAPFGAYARVESSEFNIVKGADHVKSYRSSDDVCRTFCDICGSTLQFVRDDRDYFGLAIGTLDSDFSKMPTEQIFTRDKSPWWPLTQEIPSYNLWPGAEE